MIRGETQPLPDSEQKEVLASSLSYYPSDLLVVGWLAAVVYDTPEGAAPLIQLLEYANTQLLEYRRYDEILTALLKDAYDALERRGGFFSRWRLARDAEQLNRLRLEVTELTERADNAIKFLSDMFYARAYRLAAAKVGAGDYRSLVDQKLRHRRGTIRIHGQRIPRGPRLRSGTAGDRDSDHRTGSDFSRQVGGLRPP